MRSIGWRGQWPAVGAAIVFFVAGSSLMLGCGDSEGDGEGEPEACVEFGDCPDAEICDRAEEICVAEDEYSCDVADDCPGDQICDDNQCIEDQIEDEDYEITFLAEGGTTAELHLIESRGDLDETIDTGDIDCSAARSCTVTADMSHLIVISSNEDEGYDAAATPLAGDPPAVDGQADTFAEGVLSARVRGDGVAFQRAEGSHYVAYYQPYDGDEIEIATLHDVEASQLQHRWDIDPHSGTTVQFIPPGLRSLDVRAGTIDAPITSDDQLYNIDGTAVGEGQGSFYLTSVPVGVSEDGRMLAYQVNGPNEYNHCDSDADCSGAGQSCGANDRCYVHEPTVYVVDTEHRDNLGNQCLGHDECGPVHRCDSGFDDFDEGQCAPQRITVGVGSLSNGCEVTRNDGSFSFTEIEAPLSFGPDEKVYFVGKRDCVRTEMGDDGEEANVPRTSIVAGDPHTGEYEEIYGNTDRSDIDLRGCGDVGQGVQDGTECTVVMGSAKLSPEGNDIVFQASTATGGVSPGIAQDSMDLWRVRRDGQQPAWIGESGQTLEVTDFRTHGDVQEEDDESDDD